MISFLVRNNMDKLHNNKGLVKKSISTVGILLFVISFLFLGAHDLLAQDFPATPNRLVNDYSQSLSATQVDQLERKLLAFEDSTSIQIAVVLMNSTGSYDINDYATRLAQQWGVGNKKFNNGILLLAAIGDRAVTIQTGYGIEGAVPDAIAYRIIEQEIKPAFRSNDYFTGVNQATDALISYTKGEYKADPKAKFEGGGFPILLIIVGAIVLIFIISRKGGNGRNGGGNMMNGRGTSDIFWWTLLNTLGRGGSGGGGFGDSGGDGGFGGFGGGGFGGGGASGRW